MPSSKRHGELATELGWSESLIHKVRKGEGRYAEFVLRYAAVSTEHMAEAMRKLA